MLKRELFNHIKNVGGWSTRRKLVLFSVDDYGNLRIRNRDALESLRRGGLEVNQRFDCLDNLENAKDLSLLFELLQSVRDRNGKPAVFTPYALPCNIDFEGIAANGYSEYVHELLPVTYAKLAYEDAEYRGAWELWKQGIELGILAPQFHGREHFNLAIFNNLLASGNKDLLSCLRNGSYVTVPAHSNYTSGWTAAFAYQAQAEIEAFPSIIESGIQAFNEVYGSLPKVFTPPAQHFPPSLDDQLVKWGFKAVDRAFRQTRNFNGVPKKITHKQGLHSDGLVQIVRNVVFEPTDPRGFNWVDYTFKQVEAAFRMGKPANISSHRVNFSGGIDETNREKGLAALKALLKKVVKNFPDVEFISVAELVDIISNERKP